MTSGLESETLDAAGGSEGRMLSWTISGSICQPFFRSIAESLGSSDIQSGTGTGRSGSYFKVTPCQCRELLMIEVQSSA